MERRGGRIEWHEGQETRRIRYGIPVAGGSFGLRRESPLLPRNPPQPGSKAAVSAAVQGRKSGSKGPTSDLRQGHLAGCLQTHESGHRDSIGPVRLTGFPAEIVLLETRWCATGRRSPAKTRVRKLAPGPAGWRPDSSHEPSRTAYGFIFKSQDLLHTTVRGTWSERE
jgi:hypothetical protein